MGYTDIYTKYCPSLPVILSIPIQQKCESLWFQNYVPLQLKFVNLRN